MRIGAYHCDVEVKDLHFNLHFMERNAVLSIVEASDHDVTGTNILTSDPSFIDERFSDQSLLQNEVQGFFSEIFHIKEQHTFSI
ncbi:hypothetical protein HBI71_025150 [Parastagonospora nodorum]|nr:hypothetical protein HBI71_025150 [Parastagonospora nodorum]